MSETKSRWGKAANVLARPACGRLRGCGELEVAVDAPGLRESGYGRRSKLLLP